jgi:hypothetical protein
MEAAGVARITTGLFKTGKVMIGEHIGDNNFNFRMVMHHSFQKLIKAGRMTLAEWPGYKGKSKANNWT